MITNSPLSLDTVFPYIIFVIIILIFICSHLMAYFYGQYRMCIKFKKDIDEIIAEHKRIKAEHKRIKAEQSDK